MQQRATVGVSGLKCLLVCTMPYLLQVAPFHRSFSQDLSGCEDTPYRASTEATITSSRLHLLQLFGDISYRKTNFYKKEYNGGVVWTECRLLFPLLSELLNSPIPLPDPLFTGTVKALKEINWESRWDYGIGVEWRPLKKLHFSESSILTWLAHCRIYVVYLRTTYLWYETEWSWRPKEDFRAGVDFYRECNLYNQSVNWAEFWADASWRRTNFYVNDYQSLCFAVVPKVGLKLFPAAEVALMPYITGEIALTQRSEFWQNRLLGGLGIRVMPFRQRSGLVGAFLKGSRVYAEALWVLSYFRDPASSGTPFQDFRAGITFTINWW